MIEPIQQKQSIKFFKSFIVILLLLCTCQSYTVDGQWSLTQQQLVYTQSNPNVGFKFVNNIVIPAIAYPQDLLDGHSRLPPVPSNQLLTIYACKTFTYYYFINENNIYFMPVSVSSENRPCQQN
jgi:hypothetical protein